MRRNGLKLNRIHRGLHIIRFSNREKNTHGGVDAVYFYSQYLGAIPQGNIYLKKNERYKNLNGRIHRSLMGLKKLLWAKGIIRKLNDQTIREVFAR